MPDVLTAFGLIAAVLIVSALLSGIVERAPISFPMVFLALGFLLGDHGFSVLTLDAHDPTLEIIGNLSLALVLFLDAVKLRFDEIGANWLTPALALGPGTVLTVSMVTLGAVFLLGASWTQGLLLGAILSSTDPVVLRDVLRDERIPRSVRGTLSVEAGTNDIVILPTVLILIAVINADAGGAADWAVLLGKLLVIGPAIGMLIGAGGAWLMAKADAKYGIRSEHQALYGLGLVIASYSAATAIGGDGFLAAFAAGFAVTAFSFALCDCFVEYGETTAEMAMLVAFVLFGAVLGATFDEVALLPALVFGALVLGVARPIAFRVALHRARMSGVARWFIAWFGPRGLNSLLLALLALHAGVPHAEWLLGVVGIVVVMSVVLHGVSATPLASAYGRLVARRTLEEERESSAAEIFGTDTSDRVPRISVQALAERLAGEAPPLILDVRTRSQHGMDAGSIPGSVWVLPDQVADWAERYPAKFAGRQVVTYCT